MAPALHELTEKLAAVAEHYDTHSCWPQRSMDILAQAGGWGWVVPKKWGGAGLAGAELLAAYETVARGCAATALILTQRDGAVDLIVHGENEGLRKRLLRAYARGERFTSVGIAQLTTSKRGRRPAMRAKPAGDGYVLDGVMPWVTAAEYCDEIVTGAVLPDGNQILACVPCEDPGLTIEPAMELMALGASCTGRVRCAAVQIGQDAVIAGPADIALSMRAPVKPLVVSAVGIGLAGAIHGALRAEKIPAELKPQVRPLLAAYEQTRSRLFDAAARIGKRGAAVDPRGIRVAVNELVTKLAMAYLVVSKGTGYCRPHPAERWLRESMLFLVWSAPTEVQAGTLAAVVGRESPVLAAAS